jgi:hypothetical protein
MDDKERKARNRKGVEELRENGETIERMTAEELARRMAEANRGKKGERKRRGGSDE